MPGPITPTVKTRGRATGTAFTTASATPSSNQLQLLAVWSSAGTTPNTPTVTGCGLTWVQVASVLFGSTRRLTVFRALGAAPTTGTLSIAFAGQVQTGGLWRWVELDGVATSGTNGSGAILASNTGSGASGLTGNVVAGSPTDGNQELYGAFVHTATQVSTANLAELDDYVASDAAGMVTMWGGDGAVANVSASWATSAAWGGIGIVLQPATLLGAGSTDWPTPILEWSSADPWNASPVWHAATDDLLGFDVGYGRSFELDRFETGGQTYRLDNSSGAYRISNTSSPYFGLWRVMRRVRFGVEWKGVRRWLADGFIQSVAPVRAGDYSEVTVTCVDAFETLAHRNMEPSVATLTTAFGGHADLTFTSRGSAGGAGTGLFGVVYGRGLQAPAGLGEQVTVAYVTGGSNPPIDPADVTVVGAAITVTLQQATGQADNIMRAINANGASSRLVTVTLAPGQNGSGFAPAMAATPLQGAFPQQLTGARIALVLDSIDWPGWLRDLDAGTRTVQSMSFDPADQAKALGHLQDVAATELGQLFVNGLGQVVFQDANARTGVASSCTLTDDPTVDVGALEYAAVQSVDDTARLYNYVTVSRNNGGTATSQDATSQVANLQRDLSITTILASDGALSTIAAALLAKYKDPHTRFDSVTLNPLKADPLWDQVLTRGVSDKVTMKEHPPASAAITQDCFIEAIHHSCSNVGSDGFQWVTTWALSPT